MYAARLRRIASGSLPVSAVCFVTIPSTFSPVAHIPLIGLISPLHQPPPSPENAPPLSLPSQLDLARLVDLTADRLAIGIDYDPAVVKGPAVLRLPSPVSDAELWTILNRVLASRGLTTIRLPGDRAYTVVKIPDAAAAAGYRGLDRFARCAPGNASRPSGPCHGPRFEVSSGATGGRLTH